MLLIIKQINYEKMENHNCVLTENRFLTIDFQIANTFTNVFECNKNKYF